ncbi:MAG: hypothetical protein QGF28_00365 [Candidatus Thalassarchaeaceae archaeon]|nr:hypothetical protein [Candidatus Thalassarchaeaceae archaeon]
MKKSSQMPLAFLLATLMTACALSGCLGSDDVSDSPDELEDWNVFLVQSASDLPDCDSTTDGRLYYVASQSGFQACSGMMWTTIDLTGPAGPPGADGADGTQGPAGADGTAGPEGAQGPPGPAGANGTSFTIVGSVEDKSELGEIYVGDEGDGFLVQSTSHIHVWSGSEWIDLGNISGPAGVDGVTGPQGPEGAAGADGADGADGAEGPQGSMPTVMEMTITVSSMKFLVDGIQQGDIILYRGFTYTFDQSDSSNSPHPFRLSTTSDGTHGGGTQFTSGITTTGTQGSNGLLTFTVPLDAPDTLYYYCQNHGSMGGSITIQSLGSVS